MRLYFLLAVAVLVLPLSGCAKKKASSDAVASNDSSGDSEGMGDEGMDDGMGDEGMGDGMSDEGMDDGMFDEGMDDGMFDEGMDDGMFNEGEENPGGHDEGVGDMPEGDPMAEFNESNPEATIEGGDPISEDAPGGHDEGVGDMPEGDPMFTEGMPEGEGDPMFTEGMPEGVGDSIEAPGGEGEGGRPAGGGLPTSPTQVQGVKEGSPEYVAVDFLIMIGKGDTEELPSLIAEDASDLLKRLRSEKSEKALAEAKEMIGRWKPQSTKRDGRDAIVSFKNNKGKILQFYVRRIQGKYVIRDIVEREAVERRR